MQKLARANPLGELTTFQLASVPIVLLGVGAAIAVLSQVNRAPNAALLSLALLCYLATLCLPVLLFRRSLGLLHPLLTVAAFAFLDLLRITPAYLDGMAWHAGLAGLGPDAFAELLTLDLVLRSIAFLSLILGFQNVPVPPVPRLQFGSGKAVALRLGLAYAAGMVIFAIYLSNQGGIQAVILSWGSSRTISLAGEHYWILLSHLPAYATLVWLALRPGVIRSPLFWAASLAGLAVVFLATGSRSDVLYLVFVAFAMWLVRRGRVSFVRLAILLVIGLVVLGSLGEFRRSTWTGTIDWSTLTDPTQITQSFGVATEEITNRRIEMNGTLPVLARVPQHEELLLGSSYLAVVTNVVPRSLWDGKPRLVDNLTGNTFFSINTGVPPGGVGEAYWNFHIPGVVVVFLLYGAFLAWWVRLVHRYPDQPAVLLPFMVTLMLFHDPGGPQFVRYLVVLLPVLALLLLCGAIRLPSIRLRAGDLSADASSAGGAGANGWETDDRGSNHDE